MPIYYTTRDRAKAESKGHRFEQDYSVFCSSDQEHKPLWQFSYAHGLVVGIEELADPEDPDQETQSFAILFDIATNGIEHRLPSRSRCKPRRLPSHQKHQAKGSPSLERNLVKTNCLEQPRE